MTILTFAKNIIVMVLALWLSGCASGTLVSDVHFAPHTTISPNADTIDDITEFFYTIGQPAHVSIAFVDANGQQYQWRENEPRAPGDYSVLFAGVVDGRTLPNGTYTVALNVQPDDAAVGQTIETLLTVEDADTDAPEIENLRVTPLRISPNRDGVNDVATVSYALSKDVNAVLAYLIGPDAQRYPLPPDLLRDPVVAGGHTQEFDGGVGLGAVPPPNGDYTLWVEATDDVGATSRVSATLTLENGGLPLVQITKHDVDFSTSTLLIGDTLYFTTTVTNVGFAPIRTHGPVPGTVYHSGDNYNNLGAPIRDGAFRVGLDFEGNPSANGQRYPYRWQLGMTDELTEIDGEYYLMPGQEVTVTGGLTLDALPPRSRPGFWIGLIQENVRFAEDFVGTEYIAVEGPTNAPTILPTPTP